MRENISTSSNDVIVMPFVKGGEGLIGVMLCCSEPNLDSLALLTIFLHFSLRVAAMDFLTSCPCR